MRVLVAAWKCERCGHVWLSEEEPKRCAKCKTPLWNVSSKEELRQTWEEREEW